MITDFFSHQDIEKFTKKLAETRGIALIPYRSGFIRFSLGDYLEGNESSYKALSIELECAIRLLINYWKIFYQIKNDRFKLLFARFKFRKIQNVIDDG